MKVAVVIVGVVLIALGIVVCFAASAAEAPIEAAMATDCFGSAMNPFACAADGVNLANWQLIFWAGAALAAVGVIVAIIGAVLPLSSQAPAQPVPPPVAMPAAQGSACPRCGRPLAYVAQYGRWWCAAENTYL